MNPDPRDLAATAPSIEQIVEWLKLHKEAAVAGADYPKAAQLRDAAEHADMARQISLDDLEEQWSSPPHPNGNTPESD